LEVRGITSQGRLKEGKQWGIQKDQKVYFLGFFFPEGQEFSEKQRLELTARTNAASPYKQINLRG